uniref:Branched-chain amino acid transport system ATP-binding protein/neutral amino acid transport system ATP-binding protein n=1 Tax=Candidatus Kentrum sp. MB TaxID=2138164 RepID=A0A450XQR3_9GAMM|nr:MAG: branched-chain amino acid transport system ATP-binding protein/neutral amino acid transport system ATP-binding protein [Candidatus Kentron sp. MB]VFK75868.1 MAG: branched-chain amino acid transport system ATP-binding protein/neutral amino acid transport system ATP-binding protein [Candidatus Kentron sp. MB]
MNDPCADHILCVYNLSRSFGGVQALRDTQVHIRRGNITGLIGPNGSGKTTLFQAISGMDRGFVGSIYFDHKSISGKRASKIYRSGLARTFQLSRPFPELTVMENLMAAGKPGATDLRERARQLLAKVKLERYWNVLAKDLSYGQQRLMEFLRVLMSDPMLILLDEPAAGINPTLRKTLWSMVRELNAKGTTFFIIEHDMSVIADLCTDIYVLNEGENIAHGDLESIRQNEHVLEAYFGT